MAGSVGMNEAKFLRGHVGAMGKRMAFIVTSQVLIWGGTSYFMRMNPIVSPGLGLSKFLTINKTSVLIIF